MKEQNNSPELLTESLYIEISSDKSSEIARLKESRTAVLKDIKEKLIKLKDLNIEKKEILSKIKLYKKNLRQLKKRKTKLTKKLNVQKKLSSSLNKFFSKEEVYISVNEFYPEKIKTKKKNKQ